MSIVRQATSKLIDMMDEGNISPREVADMALSFMSEADVNEMMLANDLIDEDVDEVNDDGDTNDDVDEGEIDHNDLMDDFNYVCNSNHY